MDVLKNYLPEGRLDFALVCGAHDSRFLLVPVKKNSYT